MIHIMGLYLRCNLSAPYRMTKFLLESSKVDYRRHIQFFPRSLSNKAFDNEEESQVNGDTSASSVDDRFLADMSKFGNKEKIPLPRTTAESVEFTLGSSDDPDTFGSLSKGNLHVFNNQEGSEDDSIEENFTSELPNYLPQKKYADMIKKFLRQRRFADALDVLQVTMLKEHRVKPEYYIYSILIQYCGLTGYSKMASKLFNDMKKRGLSVKPSVYTSLFNSFANSPFPSDGLQRTRHLFALMNEKGIELNQITCHAVVKAFGRCGSLEEAFKVVDYMMSHKMHLNAQTISFLFQACISDKEAGFRHALLVYRKMMEYRIRPDVFHYNLLLHCTRDCSIGDIDSTVDTLKRLNVHNVQKLTSEKVNLPLSAGYPWEEDLDISADIVSGSRRLPENENQKTLSLNRDESEASSLLPNLLSFPSTLGCVVSLTGMMTPHDRLFLLGGCEGFLKEMEKHNVKPDIKTMSLLLECSPDSYTSEKAFINSAKKMNLQMDALFFNTLIRRRVRRQQYDEAKEVLSMLTASGLQPDLMTFTNLAMTCRHITDAYELLKVMDDCGTRPSIELVTNLWGCATVDYKMKYVNLILDVIDYEEIRLNGRFLQKADDFYAKCLRVLKIRPEKFNPKTLDAIQNFCRKYPDLKKSMPVEDERHPWQHLRDRYNQTTDADKEFLSEHVEKNLVTTSKFSRLGPNTLPKLKKAKVKEFKRENPDAFVKKRLNRPIENQLRGIESAVFQNLTPIEPSK